jgi:hypothetical protein
MGKATDKIRAFHVFIVFKTVSEKDGEFWWSLEKDTEYIIFAYSASRTLSKHGPSERLSSGLRKFGTNKWYGYINLVSIPVCLDPLIRNL